VSRWQKNTQNSLTFVILLPTPYSLRIRAALSRETARLTPGLGGLPRGAFLNTPHIIVWLSGTHLRINRQNIVFIQQPPERPADRLPMNSSIFFGHLRNERAGIYGLKDLARDGISRTENGSR
jgi:hypothetical protein